MSFANNSFLSTNQFDDVSGAFPNASTDSMEWSGGAQSPSLELSLKEFSAFLKNADILDNQAINLQGSTIWLPYGMKLRRIFDQYISDKYEEYGLEQFYYPSLVPEEIFKPLDGLFNLKNRMLRVGTDDEIAEGKSRGIMSPTGEATIYHHWSKYIKQHGLPIKMYRNASYFRPVSHQAGMGIFNGMEASGVFEFHAAYADRKPIDHEIGKFQKMLEDIFSYFKVPRIWSWRPSWTNNSAISLATYGADTILPTGTSLQIGALYDQDSIFSSRYGISSKVNGHLEFTKQVAGFCSRRLMMSQLMISTSLYGRFFLHPNFSPIQAAIIFQGRDNPEEAMAGVQSSLQGSLSLRQEWRASANGSETALALKRYRDRGVPLTVLIQDKRNEEDKYRLVLGRQDTAQEIKFLSDDIGFSVKKTIEDALVGIQSDADKDLKTYFANQFSGAAPSNLEDLTKPGSVVRVFPLEFEEAAVRAAEKSGHGEILGFVEDKTSQKSIFSNAIVTTQAVLCRRF